MGWMKLKRITQRDFTSALRPNLRQKDLKNAGFLFSREAALTGKESLTLGLARRSWYNDFLCFSRELHQ
jgi:hypothetical protein